MPYREIPPAELAGDVVLVCGGRDYANTSLVFAVLDGLHNGRRIEWIVQGGAPGADQLARDWAAARGVSRSTFHANWKDHGKAAGPKRNQAMLDQAKPTLAVAFPGGRGTADMVRRIKRAGINIVEFVRDSDGTATAAANGDLPVPKDCQARAESNAHTTPPSIREQ